MTPETISFHTPELNVNCELTPKTTSEKATHSLKSHCPPITFTFHRSFHLRIHKLIAEWYIVEFQQRKHEVSSLFSPFPVDDIHEQSHWMCPVM